jgi:hypothetical protein
MRALPCLVFCGLVLAALPTGVHAVTFEDPASYFVKNTWSGASLGVPAPVGGLARHDVFFQMHAVAGGETYCAHLPAERMKPTRRALRFRDRRARIASAAGITQARLSVKKRGSLAITAHGPRTSMPHFSAGPVRVTWALRSATTSDAWCSSVTANLRAGRKGAVRYP